jgi:hypothetical protein
MQTAADVGETTTQVSIQNIQNIQNTIYIYIIMFYLCMLQNIRRRKIKSLPKIAIKYICMGVMG